MHHLSSRYIPCDGRLTASAYFDPRSPHRERHLTRTIEAGISYISIHAPRRGSDLRGAVPFHPDGYFNPRSPYEERPIPSSPRSVRSYFNPRSPHGERHDVAVRRAPDKRIPIHAPRMGSDSTVKAYSNDRIKWSTLREPHFLYSKNACFSPIVSMCATTSRTKKSENQSFIRIISRLGTYVFHLRLVSVPQIIEPYAVRLLVHQHFQCGTK